MYKKEHPSALAEDHRVLIQLLSMFENGIGCSVCMSCGFPCVCVCVCVCALTGCLAPDRRVAVGPRWRSRGWNVIGGDSGPKAAQASDCHLVECPN